MGLVLTTALNSAVTGEEICWPNGDGVTTDPTGTAPEPKLDPTI